MPSDASTAAQRRDQPEPAARRRAPTPSSPTTAACTSTEANTCAGDAPTARSSANSRIRCRTDIANVLEMMNAPTNSEIAAKTSRNVVTKPSIAGDARS